MPYNLQIQKLNEYVVSRGRDPILMDIPAHTDATLSYPENRANIVRIFGLETATPVERVSGKEQDLRHKHRYCSHLADRADDGCTHAAEDYISETCLKTFGPITDPRTGKLMETKKQPLKKKVKSMTGTALKKYYIYAGSAENTLWPVMATSLAHAKTIYAKKHDMAPDNPYIQYKTKDIPTWRERLPPLIETTQIDDPVISIEERRQAYAEKKDAKLERLQTLAAKKSKEADSLIDSARKMADVIPFGQPILVGHHSEGRDRRYRDRITARYDKGFETSKKADYYARRAEIAAANKTISSDDPDAIQKLETKLEHLQGMQEQFKAINKIVKSKRKGYTKEQMVQDLRELGLSEKSAEAVFITDFTGQVGIPDYTLTNNNSNMKRIRDRIEKLKRTHGKPSQKIVVGDVEILDNATDNRIQIFFSGRPDEETRSTLKSLGFKWAPSVGAWQRNRDDYRFRQVVDVLSKKYGKGAPKPHPAAKKAAYVTAYGKRHAASKKPKPAPRRHPASKKAAFVKAFGERHTGYIDGVFGSKRYQEQIEERVRRDDLREGYEHDEAWLLARDEAEHRIVTSLSRKPKAARKPPAKKKAAPKPKPKPKPRMEAKTRPRKPVSVYTKPRQTGVRKSVKRDKALDALPPGKRVSRTGRVYYEYRRNRSDMPGKRI